MSFFQTVLPTPKYTPEALKTKILVNIMDLYLEELLGVKKIPLLSFLRPKVSSVPRVPRG
jgi:hypothetical protein